MLYLSERLCTVKFNEFLTNLLKLLPESKEYFLRLPMKRSFRENFSKYTLPLFGLGQLFQKEEAAGKMRTFAIVDCWTQTILNPLHSYLSNLLKKIPQDGTASHLLAFDRVRAKAQLYGCSYGYDLSSATDRLPISIQTKLLGGLFGEEFGKHWANFLIGRPYYLLGKNQIPESFHYAVGQPMGARSSFVMLGLTHHMLVQYAASRLRTSININGNLTF